jgi:hypothetical protein
MASNYLDSPLSPPLPLIAALSSRVFMVNPIGHRTHDLCTGMPPAPSEALATLSCHSQPVQSSVPHLMVTHQCHPAWSSSVAAAYTNNKLEL